MSQVAGKPSPPPAPRAPEPRRPQAAAPPSPPPGPTACAPAKGPGLRRAADSKPEAVRIIINGVEGLGKTTIGAFAPKPAILMSRGETGYLTLYSAGLVPDCDYAEFPTWPELLAQIDDMINAPAGHETVVLDALGGFERLCHEYVCETQFKGDWSDKGFGSFQRGYDISVGEWLKLLAKLDRLRLAHNVGIIFLSHVQVKPFKNPLGPDFDRYTADCHAKTWGATHKWADAVLFGNFETVVVEDRKSRRDKGRGGSQRVLFAERTDAYDAKNRFGMEPVIYLPADPSMSWSTLATALGRNPVGKDEQ